MLLGSWVKRNRDALGSRFRLHVLSCHMDLVVILPVVEQILQNLINDIVAHACVRPDRGGKTEDRYVLIEAFVRTGFDNRGVVIRMFSSDLFQHLVFDRDNPHGVPRGKLAIGSNRISASQKSAVEASILKTFYGLFVGKIVRFEILLLHPMLLQQKMGSVGHSAAGTAHGNAFTFRVRVRFDWRVGGNNEVKVCPHVKNNASYTGERFARVFAFSFVSAPRIYAAENPEAIFLLCLLLHHAPHNIHGAGRGFMNQLDIRQVLVRDGHDTGTRDIGPSARGRRDERDQFLSLRRNVTNDHDKHKYASQTKNTLCPLHSLPPFLDLFKSLKVLRASPNVTWHSTLNT